MTKKVAIVLVVIASSLIVLSAAANAQASSGATPSIDFGTVGRGGSAERDVILYNRGNNSTLTYSVNFTNVTNTSGQLTATPSNVTVAVRLDVPSDAKDGNFSSSMLVNTSTAQNGSTLLPALSAKIIYTVQGNAPAQTAQGVDVPLIAGVLGVFALVAIGAVYVILFRGK
jgi:hypothetical protein